MIKRLVIHRFRGIKEGIIDEFGKINLFIGPNNSGKTAILEMLYLGGLAQRPCSLVNTDLEPSAWPAETLEIRDFLGLEPMPRLRRRHGEAKVWKEAPSEITTDGSLAVALSGIHGHYPLQKFELAPPLDTPGRRKTFSKKDIQRISMFQLEPWKGEEEEFAVPSDLIPPIFQKHDVRLEKGFWNYLWEDSFVYRWEKNQGIDYFAVWAMEGTKPKHIALFDFHTAEQHFTPEFAGKTYEDIPDWEKKIAEIIGIVFPELEGAEVSIKPKKGKDWTGFIEFAGKTPIPIDHFGDGARHAFKVIAVLTALVEKVDEQHPGLFLWEDPELFMHPASLNRLLREMLYLVKDKPIQVVLSSQSIETTALLTAHIEKMGLQSIYRVLRMDLQAGKLYVAKYNYENVIAWLKAGMDLRFWEETDLPLSYLYNRTEEEEM